MPRQNTATKILSALALLSSLGFARSQSCKQSTFVPMPESLCLTFKNLPPQFPLSFTLGLNTNVLPCLQQISQEIIQNYFCAMKATNPATCAEPGGPVCLLKDITINGATVVTLTYQNGNHKNNIYTGELACLLDALESAVNLGCKLAPTTNPISSTTPAITSLIPNATMPITHIPGSSEPANYTDGPQPLNTNTNQPIPQVPTSLILILAGLAICLIATLVSIVAISVRRARHNARLPQPIHNGAALGSIQSRQISEQTPLFQKPAPKQPSEEVDDEPSKRNEV